jgi:hypothetical protein
MAWPGTALRIPPDGPLASGEGNVIKCKDYGLGVSRKKDGAGASVFSEIVAPAGADLVSPSSVLAEIGSPISLGQLWWRHQS